MVALELILLSLLVADCSDGSIRLSSDDSPISDKSLLFASNEIKLLGEIGSSSESISEKSLKSLLSSE